VPKPEDSDDDDSSPADTGSESDASSHVTTTTIYELPDGNKVTVEPDIANIPGERGLGMWGGGHWRGQ